LARLIFYDESHSYTVDGQELPSVSELTRFISRELYNDINQTVLDRAADRGTRVHKVTEALDKYGEAECDDDILPYLQAYLEFRKKHKCEWQHIEKAMYHPDLLYAGTIDRFGTMDGENVILDIKTTSQIHTVSVTAQLTLYQMMAEANGMKVDALYVLQLKKDGKFTLKEIIPDRDLADACLILHSRLVKRKRKNKQNNMDSEES